MRVALDATYSVGRHLSGVGVYSREILFGLAAGHPEAEFWFCYRPHRLARSLRDRLPPRAHRFLLTESRVPAEADLFHGLNQRLPRARLRRAVTTFHDLFVISGEYATPEFRERFRRQAEDAAARSDRIITVSAFTAEQLRQYLNVDPARLRVIHHGVRMPEQAPPDEERENVVLHVGAIQTRKNLVRLVRAFERMPAGWRLVLIGSEGYGAREILHAVECSPRREAIAVLGYRSRAERDRWYARARLFAFPSLDEGFGLPVLEAMAWGLPVIASNRPALREVSGEAARLVDPKRTEELAAALVELASDPQARAALALAGRQRAAQFRWESAVEKTWAVYQELLGS